MPENHIEGKKPLWLLIETEIQNYSDKDFGEENNLETARKIAAKIDETGYNVSNSAGNWLQLKAAVKERKSVGRPFKEDFDKAISALTLEDIQDSYFTAMGIINNLGKDWPSFLASPNRADVEQIVQNRKVELIKEKAKELGGETGMRFLISESFDSKDIIQIMGVTEADYTAVKSQVDAEIAEVKRVQNLLESKKDASEDEKIKHLLNENVEDKLIVEVGEFDQSKLDSVKKAMEVELAEKKKKEEELAAQKAAEAAGPSLDEINADDMLEYIESIREILDFADNEKDIRIMCEQSSIPKALVEIAVSDPDKLDELEKEAEG